MKMIKGFFLFFWFLILTSFYLQAQTTQSRNKQILYRDHVHHYMMTNPERLPLAIAFLSNSEVARNIAKSDISYNQKIEQMLPFIGNSRIGFAGNLGLGVGASVSIDFTVNTLLEKFGPMVGIDFTDIEFKKRAVEILRNNPEIINKFADVILNTRSTETIEALLKEFPDLLNPNVSNKELMVNSSPLSQALLAAALGESPDLLGNGIQNIKISNILKIKLFDQLEKKIQRQSSLPETLSGIRGASAGLRLILGEQEWINDFETIGSSIAIINNVFSANSALTLAQWGTVVGAGVVIISALQSSKSKSSSKAIMKILARIEKRLIYLQKSVWGLSNNVAFLRIELANFRKETNRNFEKVLQLTNSLKSQIDILEANNIELWKTENYKIAIKAQTKIFDLVFNPVNTQLRKDMFFVEKVIFKEMNAITNLAFLDASSAPFAFIPSPIFNKKKAKDSIASFSEAKAWEYVSSALHYNNFNSNFALSPKIDMSVLAKSLSMYSLTSLTVQANVMPLFKNDSRVGGYCQAIKNNCSVNNSLDLYIKKILYKYKTTLTNYAMFLESLKPADFNNVRNGLSMYEGFDTPYQISIDRRSGDLEPSSADVWYALNNIENASVLEIAKWCKSDNIYLLKCPDNKPPKPLFTFKGCFERVKTLRMRHEWPPVFPKDADKEYVFGARSFCLKSDDFITAANYIELSIKLEIAEPCERNSNKEKCIFKLSYEREKINKELIKLDMDIFVETSNKNTLLQEAHLASSLGLTFGGHSAYLNVKASGDWKKDDAWVNYRTHLKGVWESDDNMWTGCVYYEPINSFSNKSRNSGGVPGLYATSEFDLDGIIVTKYCGSKGALFLRARGLRSWIVGGFKSSKRVKESDDPFVRKLAKGWHQRPITNVLKKHIEDRHKQIINDRNEAIEKSPLSKKLNTLSFLLDYLYTFRFSICESEINKSKFPTRYYSENFKNNLNDFYLDKQKFDYFVEYELPILVNYCRSFESEYEGQSLGLINGILTRNNIAIESCSCDSN